MKIKNLLSIILAMAIVPVMAQNTECSGTSTEASEGSFIEGYNYSFETSGNDVTATFELIEPRDGLVAFAQTYNPDFAEVQMSMVSGQTFTATFGGQADGATFTMACKFAYAGGLSTTAILTYTVGNDCGGGGGNDVLDLPVNFENGAIDYALTDFGGNASQIIADPEDATNTVVESIKTGAAEVWAGTTVGEPNGFANPIPFSSGNTQMTVRVWSPLANIPVRLKVETAGNPTISVETEAMTTTANSWETLTFDFANQANGTAPINFANTYNKASIFFNFGTTGGESGEQTYYWDDVEFVGGGTGGDVVDLPITFEDENLDYGLTDFGGNASQIIADPEDATNTVVESIKTGAAEVWAGTTVGEPNGFANPIPFSSGNTQMTVRVWSPLANIPVRFKVEQVGNPTISVETEAMTTTANSWETLTFDFANQANGTAPINFANTYNKASIFFNFGISGGESGEQTYYWDDVEFVGGGTGGDAVDLPITFEDENIEYGLTDFGGNASQIIADPEDATNTVVQSIKTGSAEVWAGTTVGEPNGFANPIPFSSGNTQMTVRVWSPLANIPIRLKVETAGNPTISVETEAMTTTANSWETLTFDFDNEAAGTAPINFANTYNKASIFFNFGISGGESGEQTYYWDDVVFGADPEPFTVADIVINSPDHNTLETALVAANLVTALEGDGPFTVFAPTDAAFDNLPAGVLNDLLSDPTGDLTEVLLYHVLGSAVTSDMIAAGSYPTLQGEDVVISISGQNVFINNAQVTVVDLEADNGVVHVINAVLIPSTVIGLEEITANHQIKVWPNPANEQVQVQIGDLADENTVVTVYDITGRVIDQLRPRISTLLIDVSAYTAGHYILRIDAGDKGYYSKLVVSH